MIKLYANENFPVDTVYALRKLGYDVQTTYEFKLLGCGSDISNQLVRVYREPNE